MENKKNSTIPVPHPSRLNPVRQDYAAIINEHRRACQNGEATYRDPATGFTVFTALYHLKRGTCCNSGCRHCPFLQ